MAYEPESDMVLDDLDRKEQPVPMDLAHCLNELFESCSDETLEDFFQKEVEKNHDDDIDKNYEGHPAHFALDDSDNEDPILPLGPLPSRQPSRAPTPLPAPAVSTMDVDEEVDIFRSPSPIAPTIFA